MKSNVSKIAEPEVGNIDFATIISHGDNTTKEESFSVKEEIALLLTYSLF